MANEDLGSISWDIKVNDGDLEDATRKVKKYGDETDNSGRKVKKNTDGMRKNFKGVSSAVKLVTAALVTMGATRALVGVISATAKFTKSISELSSITGATGKDLEYYSDQAKDIGRTTTLSASQAATAFKLIASAKPDLLSSAESLNAVTREAVTLAEAAGIDLPTAAKALGNSLNQFGAGAEEASRFINVLAAGSVLGTASIQDTSTAMKNAGVVANALGVEFETTVSVIQSLVQGGLQAAEAGTGLRNVLSILEKEADVNLRPSVVGLVGALENLEKKGLSNIEVMDLFGKENLSAGTILLTGVDAIREMDEGLRGTSTAYEQAATNVDNLTGDYLQNQSAVEALQIALGEDLEPKLRDTTQSMTDLLLAATDFVESEAFGATLGVLKTAAELFALVLVSRVLVALRASTVGMGFAATAAVTLNRALFLMGGPIGLAITAVYLLVKAFQFLTTSQEEAAAASEEAIGDTIANAVAQGGQALDDYIAASKSRLDILHTDLEKAKNKNGRSDIARRKSILREIKKEEDIFKKASDEKIRINQEIQDELEKTAGAIRLSSEETENAAAVEADSTRVKMDAVAAAEEVTRAREETAAAAKEEARAVKAEAAAIAQATQKTEDLISSLKLKLNLLGMNTRQQELYNAQLRLGENATLEQRLEVEVLTAAILDQTIAQKESTQEQENATAADTLRAANAKLVTESIQRDWERTRDTLSDALQKAGDDGFGSLIDASKKAIKQILYDWAAAKILQVTGISKLIGAGSLGSGGGIKGSVTGAAGSAAGSGIVQSLIASAAGTKLGTAVKGIGSSIAGALGVGAAAKAAAAATQTPGVSGIVSGMAAHGAGPVVPAATTGIFSKISSFATSPVGIGLAILAGGVLLHNKFKDPDGYKRSNSGFISGQNPHINASGKGGGFAVGQFESGLNVTGFARRSSQAEATRVIDLFREVDTAVSSLARAAGGSLDLSRATIGGVNQDGIAGTAGQFVGVGGKTQNLDPQFDQFAMSLAKHIEGLDEELTRKLTTARSAGDILSILDAAAKAKSEEVEKGMDDSYAADLQKRENDLIAREAELSNSGAGDRIDGNSLQREMRDAIENMENIFRKWDLIGQPPVRVGIA